MSTLEQLDQDGSLERIRLPDRLRISEARRVYMMPSAKTWLETVLPGLQSDRGELGSVSPHSQFMAQIVAYIRGDAPENWMVPKLLHPKAKGVWELRTADLRVFGWFAARGDFIISAIDSAARCKQHDLYAGYISQTEFHRDNLDLDPPKAVYGEDFSDVF